MHAYSFIGRNKLSYSHILIEVGKALIKPDVVPRFAGDCITKELKGKDRSNRKRGLLGWLTAS